MAQQQLSSEAWTNWLLDPTTQAFRRLVSRRIAALKDQWANGAFTDQGQFGTAIMNARAIGACTVMGDLLSLDVETVNGELSDEE